MSSISNIAGNALQAFTISQQVTAHNVSNLSAEGFVVPRVAFQENSVGRVTNRVIGTQDAVDISREAIGLLSNTQGFKANLNVLKAADEMTKDLLSIKA